MRGKARERGGKGGRGRVRGKAREWGGKGGRREGGG